MKFFLLYPFLTFTAFKWWGSRKQSREAFRKTLTRDDGLEETFYSDSQMEKLKNSMLRKYGEFRLVTLKYLLRNILISTTNWMK